MFVGGIFIIPSFQVKYVYSRPTINWLSGIFGGKHQTPFRRRDPNRWVFHKMQIFSIYSLFRSNKSTKCRLFKRISVIVRRSLKGPYPPSNIELRTHPNIHIKQHKKSKERNPFRPLSDSVFFEIWRVFNFAVFDQFWLDYLIKSSPYPHPNAPLLIILLTHNTDWTKRGISHIRFDMDWMPALLPIAHSPYYICHV